MIKPVIRIPKDDTLLNLKNRGTLVEVFLSDLHFGAMEPEYQYNILKDQIHDVLEDVKYDILSIPGDIFHHKYLSNSPVITIAMAFIDLMVNQCIKKNASMIILEGTKEHDAGQLNLFYNYLNREEVDVRIVTSAKFEYVKGKKILCLPEEYGKGQDYYEKLLFHSGVYDSVLMHGTYKNAIIGKNKIDLDSNREAVFGMSCFANCLGPIISGHVHTAGCFDKHFYYCGSPYRWKYGEEEAKGFLISLHNLDTRQYYVQFNEIFCAKYVTINVDDIIMEDPRRIVERVKTLQADHGIENIRIQYTAENADTIAIIKNYFRNSKNVKIDDSRRNVAKEALEEQEGLKEKYKKYEYIMDSNASPESILCRYINEDKGFQYITTDELISLLQEVY